MLASIAIIMLIISAFAISLGLWLANYFEGDQ